MKDFKCPGPKDGSEPRTVLTPELMRAEFQRMWDLIPHWGNPITELPPEYYKVKFDEKK